MRNVFPRISAFSVTFETLLPGKIAILSFQNLKLIISCVERGGGGTVGYVYVPVENASRDNDDDYDDDARTSSLNAHVTPPPPPPLPVHNGHGRFMSATSTNNTGRILHGARTVEGTSV